MKSGTNVITVLDVKLSENKPTFGSVLPTFSKNSYEASLNTLIKSYYAYFYPTKFFNHVSPPKLNPSGILFFLS